MSKVFKPITLPMWSAMTTALSAWQAARQGEISAATTQLSGAQATASAAAVRVDTAITNLNAVAAGAEPFPAFAAFPAASTRNGKAAWDVATGSVYKSNGATWGAPLGNVHDLSALGYADDDLLTVPPDPVEVPGPHPQGKNFTTHPSTLDFEKILGPGGRWNGKRYLMAHTPYPGTQNENPSICWSDDGKNFTLPPGAPNPVIPAPSNGTDYNNDPELIWISETNRVRMYYRVYRTATASQEWWYTETSDAVSWDAPIKILDSLVTGEENGVSMVTARHGPAEWRHYYINYDNTLRLRVSPDGKTLGPEQNLGNPWGTYRPWHIGMQRGPSGRYHLLMAGWPNGKNLGGQDLSILYAYSDDGKTNWVAEETPQLEASGTYASQYLYRPSFVLEDEATLKITVWYGARGATETGQQWHILRSQGRLRVQPRTLSAASKTGLRSRVVNAATGVFSRLSAGVLTVLETRTSLLTIASGLQPPQIVFRDTRPNLLRPENQFRLRYVAGVPGSTQDQLLMEMFVGTAWAEMMRWNMTARAFFAPAATPWSMFGYSSIEAATLRAKGLTPALELQDDSPNQTAAGTKVRTRYSAATTNSNGHKLLLEKSNTAGTVWDEEIRVDMTVKKVTASGYNIEAGTLRAKGLGVSVEFDDDQANQLKDGSKTRLRYAAATNAGSHNVFILDLLDPTTNIWGEQIRYDMDSKALTFGGSKPSVPGLGDVRADSLSSNLTIRLYEAEGSANYSRFDMTTGSLGIRPMLNDKTLGTYKLRWNVGGGALSDSWGIYDTGQISFKTTSAAAATANATMFLDTDGLLKYKDIGGRMLTVGTQRVDATLDFPSIPAGGDAELTVTLAGAAVNHGVSLGRPAGLERGLSAEGRVTAANTITVRVTNPTAAAIDPAAATYAIYLSRGA